jgi:hypothetical protein
VNHKKLKLAARLLDIAACKFSNHGCNDFELPEYWTDDECRELSRVIEDANGTPEDFDPDADHRMQMDWLLMGCLADYLRAVAAIAEAEGGGGE